MAGPVGFGPTAYSLGGIDVNDYLEFLRFEMGRTEGTIGVHDLYISVQSFAKPKGFPYFEYYQWNIGIPSNTEI
jgi:hypothetical protein